MKKVFLGGTCGDTTWRAELIPLLDFDYFNPFVEKWTVECVAEENRQKEECSIHLYEITSRMSGTYSIGEIIESALFYPCKTIMNVVTDGFTTARLENLGMVMEMAKRHGVIVSKDYSIEKLAKMLNMTKEII